MKKALFLSALALGLCQFTASFASLECEEAPEVLVASHSPAKITESFYMGRRESDGLYFYLERIDEGVFRSNHDFWSSYAFHETQMHDVYKRERRSKGEGWGNPNASLKSGLIGFEGLLEYKTDNELWVAFASPQRIDPYQNRKREIGDYQIEMAMAVTPGKHFVTHMGISRSFSYLLKNMRDAKKHPLHRRISLQLHAFAAKVMLERNLNRQYMITVPVGKMAEIMKKSLGGHVYEGENPENKGITKDKTPIVRSKYSSYENEFYVLDKTRTKVLWDRNKLTNPKAYSWFTSYIWMQPTGNPYVTVDLDALSKCSIKGNTSDVLRTSR